MESLNFYTILISTLSTITAATIAAILSYMAGRATRRHEFRLTILKENTSRARLVYIDFLAEADRNILKSYDKKNSKVGDFEDLGRKFSAIQIFSSDAVVNSAKDIFSCVLSAHSAESEKGDYNRSKINFIEAVKNEIKSMEKF